MSKREKIRKIMHLVNTSYIGGIDHDDEYHLARSITFEAVLESLNISALDKLVVGITLAAAPVKSKKT